jgi:hypothetical protein
MIAITKVLIDEDEEAIREELVGCLTTGTERLRYAVSFKASYHGG